MSVIAEWSLRVLFLTHEPSIVFSFPCPIEEGNDKAAWVATWHPARINPPCMCSSELPLRWCLGPWPWVRGYPAKARRFKWVGNTSAHNARCYGKTHRAAFPLSLEQSIAFSAWAAAQIEDRRRGGEERRRKEGRESAVPHWAVLYI